MERDYLGIQSNRRVRVRGIALPLEHGAWGFLFEPLIAAVAVAPSLGAFWISLVFIGAFLIRQPLKVWLSALLARRKLPQTEIAFNYLAFYSLIFWVGLIGSLSLFRVENMLLLLIFVPFGLFQIYSDVSGLSRQLIPEMTGVVILSCSAAVVAVAGGWRFDAAIALSGIFVARMIPSIIYVRNRLRLEKRKPFSFLTVFVTSLAALVGVAALFWYGLAPLLTVIVFVVLFGRAIFGLSNYRLRSKAMRIGVWEVIYGILTVWSVIVGFYFQI